MKTLLLALAAAVSASAATVNDHLGLQMYSLRVTTKASGWAAGLDKAKALGFTNIEGGGLPKGMTGEAYRAAFESRGLKLVSYGFSYDRLTSDIAGAVAEARSVGVKYVMLAWIPHDKQAFTDDFARKTAADFNTWGDAFHAAGITFMYHPHGYEFQPNADGTTPFEVLMKATKPEYVSYEMDVFWIVYAGQDPVGLMDKYPDRWRMMHIKDVRKGAQTGTYTGKAPASDDVAVGTGQVDWPSVLRKANAVGVEGYFIEDESDYPDTHLPQSLAYVWSLGL
ncbi:MAG TPA: sugar phosphate isomerase/epimerase [Opitutaceae bacterium]